MDLKQILSLHLDGYSNRKLASTLSISRNTVNHYLKVFKACDIPFKELISKTDEELRALFPSHSTINNTRFEALMSYFEKVNLARSKPGFTFQYHYYEYANIVAEPYSYTQFMEHYHRKHSKQRGSMKLEHIAGNELFIDYAGKKLEIVDATTGEVTAVEVFVATLPCSQYTYVEACLSQKKEDLIRCTENALRFFGGAPKAIVCDNLKSAVTRSSKYEADLNRSFKDFARHYNCVINPTRTYAPQDKALVENAVQLTYQRIYYPIREMTFFSLADLNKEIWRYLENYNDLLFSRKQASRKELFQSIEREHLKPLPDQKHEITGYKRAKVQKIGYVYFSVDKTYYSVPYRYIGKQVQLQFTQSKLEVYYNHERIASHSRNHQKGTYTTNKEHLSSSHKVYSEWSPSYFINLAKKQGSYVETLIAHLINQGDYPEVQYKRAMGIIQLHKQYGSNRLNTACQIALQAQAYSYRRIKNILANSMDQLNLMDQIHTENQPSHIPRHSNIRGAKTYQ